MLFRSLFDVSNDAVLFEFGQDMSGIRRFQSFTIVSVAVFEAILVAVPLRKLFTMAAGWLAPLLILVTILGFPGGHRGVLVSITGVLVLCLWTQRVWTPIRLALAGGALGLALMVTYVVAPSLPLAAQRTLAALPGIQLDAVVVDDARTTLEGRLVMREIGWQLVPHYLWRGRGFGPSNEQAPFTGHDPWGIITEHVNLGRFYSGPVGLLVNTGILGTVCMLGMLLTGSWVAMRILVRLRRSGTEDWFSRTACVIASDWIVQVAVFFVLHGDSEFAMKTFGLPLGLVLATSELLARRERASNQQDRKSIRLNSSHSSVSRMPSSA